MSPIDFSLEPCCHYCGSLTPKRSCEFDASLHFCKGSCAQQHELQHREVCPQAPSTIDCTAIYAVANQFLCETLGGQALKEISSQFSGHYLLITQKDKAPPHIEWVSITEEPAEEDFEFITDGVDSKEDILAAQLKRRSELHQLACQKVRDLGEQFLVISVDQAGVPDSLITLKQVMGVKVVRFKDPSWDPAFRRTCVHCFQVAQETLWHCKCETLATCSQVCMSHAVKWHNVSCKAPFLSEAWVLGQIPKEGLKKPEKYVLSIVIHAKGKTPNAKSISWVKRSSLSPKAGTAAVAQELNSTLKGTPKLVPVMSCFLERQQRALERASNQLIVRVTPETCVGMQPDEASKHFGLFVFQPQEKHRSVAELLAEAL